MEDKIFAFISAIMGGGWLFQILFMKYEKKKRIIESKNAELSLDEREDKIRNERIEDGLKAISALQQLVNDERTNLINIAGDLSKVQLDLLKEREKRKIAEYNMCTICDCLKRQPPRKTE